MLIGYAQVSTHEQNQTLQTDALKKAGCRKVFDDKVGGAKSERPGLEAALEYVREGDTLLVWRLDRLGRSLKDLIEIIAGLEKRGIGFRSLQESIDTTTSGGRLIFHVFGALAEFRPLLLVNNRKHLPITPPEHLWKVHLVGVGGDHAVLARQAGADEVGVLGSRAGRGPLLGDDPMSRGAPGR